DRPAPRRRACVVHGPQGLVRPGRRADLPAAFADDRESRPGALGARPSREAVFPARAQGQGRAHERDEENLEIPNSEPQTPNPKSESEMSIMGALGFGF